MSQPLNVWSMSDEEIGRKMSNFAHTPFIIDGVEFGSVEAFYVWLLLSTTATERKLERVRPMWGLHAKRLAPHTKPPSVAYRGSTMKLGGPEHIALIRRALRAKLDAHPEIAREFVATGPRPIAHDTGHPDKPDAEFPRETFCRLLNELRDELASENH
jgi:predicted NAD-dependent protein-ADP-ribosyltransferase YbiA (DUF1768 family)